MAKKQKSKPTSTKAGTAKKEARLEVTYMPIGDIVPYTNNPRKNEDAVPEVAASIRQFGFRVPVCVDKDNVLVYGHTRLLAAKELGMTELPVVRADDLTPAQVRAFRLADNKVSEKSGWDYDKLSKELDKITIDMGQFGFTDLGAGLDDLFDGSMERKPTAEKKAEKIHVKCPHCGEEFDYDPDSDAE